MKGKTDNRLAYLEPYLQSGSKKDIALAKAEYRKQAKSKWAKDKRKNNKYYVIYFSNHEALKLLKATEGDCSVTAFIKEAALNHIHNRNTQSEVIIQLKPILLRYFALFEKGISEQSVPAAIGKYLILKLTLLEREIMQSLTKSYDS